MASIRDTMSVTCLGGVSGQSNMQSSLKSVAGKNTAQQAAMKSATYLFYRAITSRRRLGL